MPNAGSKGELSDPTDAGNAQPLGEGFEWLITSAGNKLTFRSPAERYSYQQNPANSTQLGRMRGEHQEIQDNAAQ